MKTNWKTVVEKQNKKTYQWPEGWDTREEVAEQLECSTDRVGQVLAPGIRAGEIEVQAFPVWDDLLKRVVRVTGYRRRAPKEAKPVVAVAPKVTPHTDTHFAVLRIMERHPKASPRDNQKLLPRRFRGVVTLDDIRRILD